MNLIKTVSVLRQFNAKKFLNNNRSLTLTPIKRCTSSASNTSIDEKIFEKSDIVDEKKTMKAPFMKNFFVGNVNPEFLEYPEYASMEFVNEVYDLTAPVEEYFLNCIDSEKIDEMKQIPLDHLKAIKDFKLYGLNSPNHLGGAELDNKCLAYHFESMGSDISLTTLLNSHYRALNTLLQFGTEEQKERFLPGMSSGDINVAVCLAEKTNILSISEMSTIALPNDIGDWKLNGKKIWVPEGNNANYFLVFAKTALGNLCTASNTGLTLFLVDKNTPGVKCGVDLDQLGTRGVNLCDVTFDDVVVPKENIIGEIGAGTNIAVQCLSNGRLGSAAATIGYLKNLLKTIAHYTAHNKIEDKALYTLEYYQKQLGVMATDIYALESMVYLTAGLKDTYDNPDLILEEAAVKIFSMEKVVELVDLAANLVGGSAYIKGSPLERSIRDARSYLIYDLVPINVSKIHLVTLGLHHAGINIKDEIKKARNPFNFPGFALKNFFNNRDVIDDSLKGPETLRLSIHPSLSGDADKLEVCALRMEAIVKNLFTRWGIEVIDRHMDLIKLADCAVDMYAMSAALGRASRAYCIGLGNSNYDLVAANVICGIKSKRVKEAIKQIYDGPMESYDTSCISIGEQVAMQKGYFFQHPIDRNY